MPRRSSRSTSLVTPRRPSDSWGVKLLEEDECERGRRKGGEGEVREELASGNSMQGHHRHVADECE
jgi:hypothetical protein